MVPCESNVDDTEAATAEVTRKAVLRGDKVHFQDQSKEETEASKWKWKERRVYLDLDVLSYTDSSLLNKKRTLLQLTDLSTVDVLVSGDMNQVSSIPEPFFLKVEGKTFDNKKCVVVFALSDVRDREAWQSVLQQAIHVIGEKSEAPNVCSPRMKPWRAESASVNCRVLRQWALLYYGPDWFCFRLTTSKNVAWIVKPALR